MTHDELMCELVDKVSRIDERTGLMQRDCCEMKNHLIRINGTILKHEKQIAENTERSENNETRSANNVNRFDSTDKKFIGLYGLIISVLIAVIVVLV